MERASNMHPSTSEMRGGIMALYLEGESTKYITEKIGVSKRTVERWIKRYKEEGTTKNRHRSGRPRITTVMQDQEIIKTMEVQPVQSAVAVCDKLELECSSRTVVRRLRESGLFARIPATKPVLTGRTKEQRLGFARQYVDMPIDFWQKVIFCDEKVFSSEGLRPQSVWRRINTR